MANDLRARLGLKDGGPAKLAAGGAVESLRTRLGLKTGGVVHMQDGGRPPKRGVSALAGYGEGAEDPTAQALLAIRRNLGEAGRAVVGAKPYDETNPTETYRAMQALMNAPTPAAIIPEAAQAAGKAAGVLSGLGALGVVKPKGAKAAPKQMPSMAGLSAQERAANLAKFLEGSAIQERMYHGTGSDFSEFKPSRTGAMGPGIYFTERPDVASSYSDRHLYHPSKQVTSGKSVYPVHVRAKNPLVIDSVNDSPKQLFEKFDPDNKLTDDEVMQELIKQGYDGVYAKADKELMVFTPEQVKSAIGNRGTFDPSDPDITKAAGGVVHMQDGGKLPPGVRRAISQQRGTVAPIPGVKKPAEFIGGYVGADPRYSVMDPDADALERAYRAGEATSVIGDIVGSISPFATASTLARANALPGAAAVKGAAKKAPAFTARELKSETNKVAKAIAKDNPKMAPEDVQKRAATIAEKNLTWTRQQKPELEKTYGRLIDAPSSASVGERLQNVPEVVSQRAQKAEEFLAQPTEAWKPPRPELQAFDREAIKYALEGFPGVEQTRFPRYEAPRANLSYIDEIYQDPRNRAIIQGMIKRGLPLGGESFYASLYPVKLAALERGIPEEKFNEFIYSIAPVSARNTILNEMAGGQFLRDMHARGIPITEENVLREKALFAEKYGVGLPLFKGHYQGAKEVLEGGLNLRDLAKSGTAGSYKIPTYGTQKAGDFGKSYVLDVHEASGQTQGSQYHPYFSEQGGFGRTEYGPAENYMLGMAKELGLPAGMAQAGRWFGGGELTGLASPRGDALDLLEKQVAYTLHGQGINPTPRVVRNYVLDMIGTGQGQLMPFFESKKRPALPDYRTEKKEGGKVSGLSALQQGKRYA